MAQSKPLEVYTVVDSTREGQKARWTRIGAAWKNSDGSLNVKLDALPVNGTLNIRKPRERSSGDADE
jgi:hypothetical protein